MFTGILNEADHISSNLSRIYCCTSDCVFGPSVFSSRISHSGPGFFRFVMIAVGIVTKFALFPLEKPKFPFLEKEDREQRKTEF